MIRGVDGHMDLRDLKRVKDENFGERFFLLLILGIVNIDILNYHER